MTDPAVKIASAFCVILAGVCATTLFRHDAPVPAPAPNSPAPAAIQVHQPSNPSAVASPDDVAKELKPIRPATSDTFLGERPTVPPAAWERQELPPAFDEGFRIHKIVDGDSLESLAERYLGFSARAGEIFEANRSVLSDPEILPIGLDLKIPAMKSPATGPRSSQRSRP